MGNSAYNSSKKFSARFARTLFLPTFTFVAAILFAYIVQATLDLVK